MTYFRSICCFISIGMMMATADRARCQSTTNPSTTQPADGAPLVAQFADGMKIELRGVYNTQSSEWWYPDGSAMNDALYDPAIQGNRTMSLEFSGVFSSPDKVEWSNLNTRRSASNAALGYAGVVEVVPEVGDAKPGVVQKKRNLPNHFRLINMGQSRPDTISIKLRFATTEQRTFPVLEVGVQDTVSEIVPKLGEVELSNPREVDGMAAIDVNIPKPPEGMQVVVVAKAKVPKFLEPEVNNTIGGTNGEVRTIRFRAKVSEVADFHVNVRSYDRWVEFQNISQKARVISSPNVITSEDPAPATQKSTTNNPKQ